MKAKVTLVRAVGSEFVGRILKQTWWIAGIIAFLAFIGSVWLTGVSAWWWILVVVVIILDILVAVFYLLAWLTVKILRPHLSYVQDKKTKEFVDKFETVLEVIGTPFFLIPFFLLWDMLRGNEKNFIESAISDSSDLKKDFSELLRLFSEEAHRE